MLRFIFIVIFLFFLKSANGQVSYDITFEHEEKIVHGTFTAPSSTGKFPTIIINPGSGANDRDGTVPMIGANVACLYPELLGDTLRPYKELADAFVDAGYAVLRYDKLEFTYPTSLQPITFQKLWLPVESAIDYIKTRPDVDTNKLILIGHSEGSTLIPFIAKGRTDIAALISIAGARTPFDSILAYQWVHIARTCNGDTAFWKSQAQQVLSYFNLIRTNNWNSNTPPLFGVPASAWFDYVKATDPVADNYNIANLPTLFIGLGLDINVPPAELIRFENEVFVSMDFWTIPDLIHFMTPAGDPHVSKMLTDTIIFWLDQVITSLINYDEYTEPSIDIVPNPFHSQLEITINKSERDKVSYVIRDTLGMPHLTIEIYNRRQTSYLNLGSLPDGIYYVCVNWNGKEVIKKIIKQ